MKYEISIKQAVKQEDFLGLALLVVVFVAVFLGGLRYIGTLSAGHHQWLTAETMKFTENWVEDGIQSDNFLTLEIPKSIEYAEITNRGIYSSYPIGSEIPIFFFKKLLPNTNTLKIIHIYGYVNLFLVAVLIYFFVILSRIDTKEGIPIFALIAGISYLLLPSTKYWHSLVYFADQAIVLPFMLILFSELLIRRYNKKNAKYLQSIFLFWGMTIDYFTLPLVTILTLFRFISPLNEENRLKFIDICLLFAPIFLALGMQLLVLYENNLILPLYNNFLFRAGLNSEGSKLITSFFRQFFLGNLGIFPFAIYCICLIIGISFLFYKKNLAGNIIGLIGLLACSLQVLLLRNHSVIHDFSALKFYAPICFLFFGYFPGVLYNYYSKPFSISKVFIVAFLLLILSLSIFAEKKRFEPPSPEYPNNKLAEYLRLNSKFEDVYIGINGIEIGLWPPQTLAVSRKLVHTFPDESSVKRFLDGLPVAAKVYIVYAEQSPCLSQLYLQQYIHHTDFTIGLIDRRKFESLMKCF